MTNQAALGARTGTTARAWRGARSAGLGAQITRICAAILRGGAASPLRQIGGSRALAWLRIVTVHSVITEPFGPYQAIMRAAGFKSRALRIENVRARSSEAAQDHDDTWEANEHDRWGGSPGPMLCTSSGISQARCRDAEAHCASCCHPLKAPAPWRPITRYLTVFAA